MSGHGHIRMFRRPRSRRVFDLDEEEIVFGFTDPRTGRKRMFRLVPSVGVGELIAADGRRFIMLLLEEVEHA